MRLFDSESRFFRISYLDLKYAIGRGLKKQIEMLKQRPLVGVNSPFDLLFQTFHAQRGWWQLAEKQSAQANYLEGDLMLSAGYGYRVWHLKFPILSSSVSA